MGPAAAKNRDTVDTDRLTQIGDQGLYIFGSRSAFQETCLLGDLRQQRETIVRSSANLRGVSDQLERSGRKLREMGRRALANKLIMYVMIGLLAAGCFFLLYVQTIGGAASPPPSAAQPPTKGRRLLFAPE